MLRRDLLTLGCGLAAMPALARAAATPLGPDNPIVEAFVQAQKFQGVVMIGRGGVSKYARAFGMAEVETGRAARIDTPYAIASISKWLTTTAVMKLVEGGKLDLDAPITRHLPQYRPDTGARLSLRRLLSNTSGLPNDFNDALKTEPALLTTPVPTAEAVRRFTQGDLRFEPGAKFDYAYTNWIVVLAIVEAVTGQPFETAMRDIVLAPLRLDETGANDAFARNPRTAASYRTVEPLVRRGNDRLPMMAAAGGYFSTAGDLLRAAHLIWDTGFLAPSSLRQMKTILSPGDAYALGGRIRTLKLAGSAVTAGWETGNTAGYRSVLGHRFDTRDTVVILNNTSMSQKTLDEFADSLFGVKV